MSEIPCEQIYTTITLQLEINSSCSQLGYNFTTIRVGAFTLQVDISGFRDIKLYAAEHFGKCVVEDKGLS